MTRANFLIITPYSKARMQGNSSCYPSNILKDLINFAISTASSNPGATNGFYPEPDSRDIATFIDAVGLTFGSVGNPTYYYEIDFVKQTLKIFGTRSRWVMAPLDWEAKGWRGVYQDARGRIGYMDHDVKGKCIFNKTFTELLACNPLDEAIIALVEQIKS
jgi:hypothetical protein